MKKNEPLTEEELLQRCQQIEGLTFSQLANQLKVFLPKQSKSAKGWIGSLLELALGTSAGNKPVPDFQTLQVEMKTLPIKQHYKVAESTFICSVPLMRMHQENWQNSTCYNKLKRILWVLIEGDKSTPYSQRRIGPGFLWTPTFTQLEVLKSDWSELTEMISIGAIDKISANIGTYLQIRPKAANSKSLCFAYDEAGNKIKTLPLGFYLRPKFTNEILKQKLSKSFSLL